MRPILILLVTFLLSGCFFITKDGTNVKIYGSPKENALEVLRKTEETKEEDKKEIKLFQEKTVK